MEEDNKNRGNDASAWNAGTNSSGYIMLPLRSLLVTHPTAPICLLVVFSSVSPPCHMRGKERQNLPQARQAAGWRHLGPHERFAFSLARSVPFRLP